MGIEEKEKDMIMNALCKDTGSIYVTSAEMSASLCAGRSYFQGRPEGMRLKVRGTVVRKGKEGEVLSREEKELEFREVWTTAGGKKNRDTVTFFPAMNGVGEWEPGSQYQVEVTFQ